MAEGSRSGRYVGGLVTGYAFTFLTMLIGFWLTPFTLKYLNREEFAIFTLASDLVMWLTLVDLGISSSLRVKAARLTGKGGSDEISRIASTAFFAELGVGLAVFLLGFLFSYLFPGLFEVSEGLRGDARNVMVIFAFSTAINIGLQTFSSLLIAHQQIHVDNAIRILVLFLRTAVTVALLVSGWKIYSIAVANLVAVAVLTVVAGARCWLTIPEVKIRPGFFSMGELKSLGVMGFWFTVGGLAGILIENMDRAIAAKAVSLESVTTMALTGRLYLLSYGLVAQITNTARPAIGQLLGAGDFDGAKKAYEKIFLLSTGFSISAGLGILAGNGPFVRWWVGEQNYGGFWLDLAFAAGLVANSWVMPHRATLAAGLVVKENSLSRIAEGALKFIFSAVLGFYWGLPGVVAGTAAACCMSSFWYLPFLTAGIFKEDRLAFFRKEVGSFLPLIALGTASGATIRYLVREERGIVPAASAMALEASFCLLLLWFLVLKAEHRKELKNRIFSAIRVRGAS